jgi:nucleoside-diphosphate-sugar epimerase
VIGPERVLVTGGTGFLGGRLARRLRGRGLEVRVLVRDRHGSSSAPAAAQELDRIGAELAQGDVLDPGSLRTSMEGVSAVYHLAGRLFAPGVPPSEYERLHVEGTGNVIRAAAEARSVRRVVHCSTTGVLGPTGLRPVAEEAPANPSNAYERSKAEGERVAVELASRAGLSLAVARPGLVYGPGDLHLLGWFRAIAKRYYRVVGRGDNLLHPIYVDDVLDGFELCRETPGADGRAYNLVGERALPIRDLAAAIALALDRPLPRWHLPAGIAKCVAAALEAIPGLPPEHLPLTRSRVAFMTESRAYCGCRARDELGFRPKVSLPEGLARTVAWYRSEGLL